MVATASLWPAGRRFGAGGQAPFREFRDLAQDPDQAGFCGSAPTFSAPSPPTAHGHPRGVTDMSEAEVEVDFDLEHRLEADSGAEEAIGEEEPEAEPPPPPAHSRSKPPTTSRKCDRPPPPPLR